MYVSELDRPWIETPFLFQGFPVENEDQIAELQSVCKYVYVDKQLSLAESVQNLVQKTPSSSSNTRKPTIPQPGKFREVDFRESLVKSYRIYKDARGWIDTMLEDSRLGNSVDTDVARNLVTEIADQVIQNPDALVWLTHMKARDEYTATHCINVCILALTFGRCMGLQEGQLQQLGMGALLHDIGKMRVPSEILNKPGKLTKEEFEVIMEHPVDGHTMLRDDHQVDPVSLHIVMHHHERLDGAGYPNGLNEQDIPQLTRISSIVDVYDAITSDRCYHDGMAPAHGLESLFKWAKGNFDVSLLEHFIKCIGIFPIGSVVRLNTRDIGLVVSTGEGRRLKPIVLLVKNSKGELYQQRRLINLSSSVWEGTQMSIEEVMEPGALGENVRSVLEDELQLSGAHISKVQN